MSNVPALLKLMVYFNSANKEEFNYPAKIAKQLNITPTYIYSLIKYLQIKGVIYINKIGRVKEINLTPQGNDVCTAATIVYEVLNNDP